eukprot:TRINITY_DN4837_c0_g2_i1.p1 TRINITY_DN4837_c0_g2~~TRINITY_DN4837_c0_g2_i1.p1  ORF type:complete len:280 (-),score=9.92 TRINITY_DN4837_c0_g2_i1:165-1004(-)
MPKVVGVRRLCRALERGTMVDSKDLPYEEKEVQQWMDDINAAVRRMRSGPSYTSVYVTFRNETNTKVKTFWIDYSGREVEYETIDPGKEYRQQTYMEHPWVFRRARSSSRLAFNRKIVVYPCDQPQGGKILIQNPRALQWTRDNHRQFPGLFKERTRLLLLCHNFYLKGSNIAESSSGSTTAFVSPLAGAQGNKLSPNGKLKQKALFSLLDKALGLQGASEPSVGTGEVGSCSTMGDEEFCRRFTVLPSDILVRIIGFMAPAIMDVEIPQPSSNVLHEH